MVFSRNNLHFIIDNLASPDCAEALLVRQISGVFSALESGTLDQESEAVFGACLQLFEERLLSLLQEKGWSLTSLEHS